MTAEKSPVVRYLDETDTISCPYGDARRIVTGGLGGVANVHVIRVTRGAPHVHAGYDEVYYVLAGSGRLTISGQTHVLRPGAVAVIPAGEPHELNAESDAPLEFIIFGAPAMDIDDPRAKPTQA